MPDTPTSNRLEKRDPLDTVLFHKLSGGDPNSFVAQFFELFNDVLQRQPKAPNGVGPPGQLRSSQLEAIEQAIKSLPSREDMQKFHVELLKEIRGGGENRELTAFLDNWRVNEARKSSRKGMITQWIIHISVILVIAVALIGAGWGICWINLHAAADARIDRIINSQPAAAQATAALSAHGGSITIGPINGPDGRQARGIIVRPGDLRQGMSTDGAVLLTLP